MLFENVQQSKILLKKIGLDSTNKDYLKIRSMISGHDGLVFWFTKLFFIDKIIYSELETVFNTIKSERGIISKFQKNVVDLENLEEFWDEYLKAKSTSIVRSTLNEIPSLLTGGFKFFGKREQESKFRKLVKKYLDVDYIKESRILGWNQFIAK